MPIIIVVIALVFALLQSTIIPASEIYGSYPDLVLAILLLILFFDSKKLAGIYIISASIFISIFSATGMVHIILPYFLIFLLYIFFSDRRLISRPSVTFSFFIFALANLLKIFFQLVLVKNFNLGPDIILSSLLTAFAGIIIYYFCRRIYFFLNPQILKERIKISHL
ncbi:MAG: hypothetical protein WC451_02855 [Patescibacteria group bacterium]|jgi:hypothetical protein